jgi:GT2 family glycosyltransferase
MHDGENGDRGDGPLAVTSISVIIASLERDEILADSLASISRCDPPPFEVIVVEGTSQKHDESIRLLRDAGIEAQVLQSPPGVSRQRNLGISRARGDIMVFLDDDVTVDRGFFRTVVEAMKDESIVAVTGFIDEPRSRRFLSHNSRLRPLVPGGGRPGQYTRYGYPRYVVTRDQPLDVKFMPGCLMCVRSEAARAVGFDERLVLAEDEDFAFRLTRLGRVRYDPRLTIHHHKLGFRGRNPRKADRELVQTRRYLFEKNFDPGPLGWLEFRAFEAGLLLHRVANLDFEGVAGLVDGMRTVRPHDVAPVPAATPPPPDAGDDSLVTLLHPDGLAGSALTIERPSDPVEPADVTVIRLGRSTGLEAWARVVRSAAGKVLPDGVVHVVGNARARRCAEAQLEQEGFELVTTFVQRPSRGPARLLVPLDRGPGRYALALAPLRGGRRALAGLAFHPSLGSAIRTLAPAVAQVYARRGARRPLDWLRFAGREPQPGRTILLRTGAGRRLFLFDADGDEPVLTVVLRKGGGLVPYDELRGPSDPAGTVGGAIVPERQGEATLGDEVAFVESVVPGRLAAAELQSSPARLGEVLGLVEEWLRRWHVGTKQRGVLSAELLEGRVLAPARANADIVGEDYLSRLERFAAELEGTEIPLVAAHGDLTMWNVLLRPEPRLAVVDWETAGTGELPLTDLLYAAADAVAAVGRYTDRPSAFQRCFGVGEALAGDMAARAGRLAAASGVDQRLVPLLFHACWLRHAANERAAAGSSETGPFRQIARRLDRGLAAWAELPR